MAQRWVADGHITPNREFLWIPVPAFASCTRGVTICRSTHPSFLESLRWFGVPDDHPSRLENHATGSKTSSTSSRLVANDWCVTVHSQSGVCAVRYQIRDRANPTRALGVATGGAVTMVGVTDPSALWYIVPAPPLGWAIHHAPTGWRLEADRTSGAVVLRNELDGPTHWDFLRFSPTKGTHVLHFWLHPFLHQPFAPTRRMRPRVVGMEATVGVNRSVSTNEFTSDAEAACVQRCQKTSNCTAATWSNEGACNLLYGAVPDASPETTDFRAGRLMPLVKPAYWGYPFWVIDLERKLFGDPVDRGAFGVNNSFGTGEYAYGYRDVSWGPSTNFTLYRRVPEAPAPEDTYRQCLLTWGMDDPTCAQLRSATADPDALDRKVLPQYAGQTRPGLCGPLVDDVGGQMPAAARLWSQTCNAFCMQEANRNDGQCKVGLAAYCAAQTEPGANDPLCECYLTQETYDEIERRAIAKLGPDGAEVAKAVRTTMAKLPPYCMWSPCRTAPNRPDDSTCPAGTVYNCIQIDKDISFAGGGTNQHLKQCNMGTTTPAADDGKAAAAADNRRKAADQPAGAAVPPSGGAASGGGNAAMDAWYAAEAQRVAEAAAASQRRNMMIGAAVVVLLVVVVLIIVAK